MIEVDYDYVRSKIDSGLFNLSQVAKQSGVSYASLINLRREPNRKLSAPLTQVLEQYFRKVNE